MNDMPFIVQHNVSIVSVLDLQHEGQQTVASHAGDEVTSGLHGTVRKGERARTEE